MEEKKTPNLFDFATSELSHDAFIAWLLSWADPAFEDEPLHSFSRSVLFDFINMILLGKTGLDIPVFIFQSQDRYFFNRA